MHTLGWIKTHSAHYKAYKVNNGDRQDKIASRSNGLQSGMPKIRYRQ